MSSLRAPWKNGPYKNKHTEQHKKNKKHQDETDIQKKHYFCVLRIVLLVLLFMIS